MLYKENAPRVHERPDQNPIQQWGGTAIPGSNQAPQTYYYQQPQSPMVPQQGQAAYQQPYPAANHYQTDKFGRMVQQPPVQYQQQQGYPPVPMVQQQVVVQQQPRGTNHGLHIILSFITGGLWIPVWLVVWAVRGR